MNTVTDYSTQGLRSWAAYANLQVGAVSIDALINKDTANMTDALATSLSTRYTVEAIHNDLLTRANAVV